MARKRTYKILLSDDDKKLLNSTIHNKNSCKTTIRRCQILLKLDENLPRHLTQMQIAVYFGVSKATVFSILVAYVKSGITAIIRINRKLRFNARRKLDGQDGGRCGQYCLWTHSRWGSPMDSASIRKKVRLELDKSVGREAI